MKRTRTHEIHLRLNDKEYATLKRNSAKCGLTQQSYIRQIIEDVVPRESPSADFWTLYQELRHMTSDLHNIAWKAYETGTVDWSTYWNQNKKVEEELFKVLAAVRFPEWIVKEIDAYGKCTKFEYTPH